MVEAGRERPPGRPRSADIDAAILAAAVDLLIERGIDAVTIEQVARRAGVTRATVYRRFPDKVRLLVAAIGASQDAPPPPPEPYDIERMLAEWARYLARPRLRQLSRRLMTSLHDYPALREAYWNAGIRRREEALRASLELARDQGRFPPSADLAIIQTILTGAVGTHLTTQPDTSSEAEIRDFLLAVLHQTGYRNSERPA